MDANEALRDLRLTVRRAEREFQATYRDPSAARLLLHTLAEKVEALDAHLSGGGRPPEAWAEGPDAPELDECAHNTVVMGRCDDCGAYPHGHYGMEPLGGPVPGVGGSHLPELSDNYGHRVNPL